jgi:hypothetical protein
MIWLGSRRGYLSDWITQRWVQFTGRRIDVTRELWLRGPVGKTTGIGRHFFAEFATESGLDLRPHGLDRGLILNFDLLTGPSFDASRVSSKVIRFYEQTSNYELDVWAEWCGAFRPFGWLLAVLFSRRLQQLNVPLSGLDTSRGVTSEILQLVERSTGRVDSTAWVRHLLASNDVLYAGSYSLCNVPNRAAPCVKVVFPLPNGNAIVLMKPVAHEDGSLSVTSSGERFGDAGFYFTVRDRDGFFWVRYVRSLRESIRVYEAEDDNIRADHVLTIWGATFLRLHYRLRLRTESARASSTSAIGERA